MQQQGREKCDGNKGMYHQIQKPLMGTNAMVAKLPQMQRLMLTQKLHQGIVGHNNQQTIKEPTNLMQENKAP